MLSFSRKLLDFPFLISSRVRLLFFSCDCALSSSLLLTLLSRILRDSRLSSFSGSVCVCPRFFLSGFLSLPLLCVSCPPSAQKVLLARLKSSISSGSVTRTSSVLPTLFSSRLLVSCPLLHDVCLFRCLASPSLRSIDFEIAR